MCFDFHFRPKFGKKKTPLKRSSTQTSNDAEAEDESGSSSLLARIRARNLLLTDDGDDANPTGLCNSFNTTIALDFE